MCSRREHTIGLNSSYISGVAVSDGTPPAFVSGDRILTSLESSQVGQSPMLTGAFPTDAKPSRWFELHALNSVPDRGAGEHRQSTNHLCNFE